MHSVAVILCEEKQETRILYFFSYDMSSLVIQVFSVSTVSRSYQKHFFFSPEEYIFKGLKLATSAQT